MTTLDRPLALAGLFLSVAALGSCTTPAAQQDAAKILQKADFTDIKTHGAGALYDCAKDYMYTTKFTAKTSAGNPVKGTVCSGALFTPSAIVLK